MANPIRTFRAIYQHQRRALLALHRVLTLTHRQIEKLQGKNTTLARENGRLRQVLGGYQRRGKHGGKIPCEVCGTMPAGQKYGNRCRKHPKPGYPVRK